MRSLSAASHTSSCSTRRTQVFDGHGFDNGALAATVASETARDFLVERFAELRTSPEPTMVACFEVGAACAE